MVKGIVVPADPEQPIQIRGFNGLEDYQAVVGGWIEAIEVPPLGVTMYVNEEGLLQHLPFNSRATFLWWFEVPERRRQLRLVGDVLMVGLPDDDGESTDIPDSTLARLTREESYVVLVQYSDSPRWVPHPFPYDSYINAVVWAVILTDRVTDARAVRIVIVDQLDDMDLPIEDGQSNLGHG